MIHHRGLLAALVATFLASSLATAQVDVKKFETFNMTKFGQAGMKFLEIGLSARAEGMGGAVTGVDMGASSVFYNPAGLANPIGAKGDVFVSRTQWVADMNVNAAAASYKTPWATVAVSLMAVDYGTIKGYRMSVDGAVQSTGNIDVSSSAFGIGLARQVTDKFQVGVTGRYVSEDFGLTAANSSGEGAKATTFAFDAGTLYRTGLGSSVLSMSIRNFSRQARHQDESYDLPLIFRIGLAMDVLNMVEGVENPSSLIVSLDALHPRDRSEEAVLGVEYNFQRMISVRAALKSSRDYYSVAPSSATKAPIVTNLASLGAGIGCQVGPTHVSFNYAWSDQGTLLGSVNRFDLQVGF